MSKRGLVVLVGWVLAAVALAAGHPAHAAPREPERAVAGLHGGTSHLWLVLPGPGENTVRLEYVLPQGLGGQPIGDRAPVRPELREVYLGAAAWENNVYLLFQRRPPSAPPHPRRTYSLRSVPFRGGWTILPTGRMETLPELPATGSLYAFGATPLGLAAALDTNEDPEPSLHLLREGVWERHTLPPAAATALGTGGGADLFGADAGVALLVTGEQRGLWLADLGAEGLQWRAFPLPQGVQRARACWSAGAVVLAGEDAAGVAQLWSLDPSENRPEWRVFGALPRWPQSAELVPAGDSKVNVVWVDVVAHATSKQPVSTVNVIQVSSATGRVLYEGTVGLADPVSPSDVRFLAMLLGITTGSVLAFIIRPKSAEAPVVLPPASALAEPGRRMLAAVIDLYAALFVASKIVGAPFTEVLAPSSWFVGEGQMVYLIAIGLLIVTSTALEASAGRTLGKMVTGCEVVAATVRTARPGEESPRPALWRAFLRNLVKWGLPPVGLLGLMDMNLRHRGDLYGSTAVIIRVEQDEEGPEGEDDER